jgi:hypothetical protein
MSLAVLQNLLDLFAAPTYLEISVDHGMTFHGIRASPKVAVDPVFSFDERPDPPRRCTVVYHEVSDDVYFGNMASSADRFDVIYLDGLHTFEQTLRDLIKSLSFLSSRRVIIIDDVLPNFYPASLPLQTDVQAVMTYLKMDKNQAWIDYVYKLGFFIESFFQQFSFATVQEGHG